MRLIIIARCISGDTDSEIAANSHSLLTPWWEFGLNLHGKAIGQIKTALQ